MAERRMFTQKIIDSDPFLDMPLSTQALYFHLNMRADDDGFVNNPKRIQRTIGASEDDLKLLVAKRFVIGFENGVIVIKHWRMHNTLRKDRYNPTQYQEEFALLDVKGNNAYTEKVAELPEPEIESVATTWQPSGNHLVTQDSIGKGSVVKVSLEKESEEKDIRHKYGEYKNVLLSDSDLDKLKDEFPSDYQERIENLSAYIASTGKSYKNHLATIRNWARKDKEQTKTASSGLAKSFDTNEFFNTAMRKSYGRKEPQMHTPSETPKTAADDENIRKKMEALKERLG